VGIGGHDQADLWGSFRVARAPNVRALAVGPSIVVGEHDGYAPVVHRRTFVWLPGAGLVVVDRLAGGDPRGVVTRLPLAPGARLDVQALGDGPPAVERPARYAPYLGVAQPTVALTREPTGRLFGWAILRPGTTARLEGGRLLVSGAHGLDVAVA
jgi:hypothetical protein